MAAEIKKEEDHNKMGTKDIFPLLMGMSLPMMLSMLVQSLYNIVDSIYVSRLGTQALTAVSLAYPLQNIVVSVAVGIGVGISSVLSISLGEKNQQRANQAATMGILLTGIHCILFVIAGILVTKPFLGLFTQDEAVFAQACDYTYIVRLIRGTFTSGDGKNLSGCRRHENNNVSSGRWMHYQYYSGPDSDFWNVRLSRNGC